MSHDILAQFKSTRRLQTYDKVAEVTPSTVQRSAMCCDLPPHYSHKCATPMLHAIALGGALSRKGLGEGIFNFPLPKSIQLLHVTPSTLQINFIKILLQLFELSC